MPTIPNKSISAQQGIIGYNNGTSQVEFEAAEAITQYAIVYISSLNNNSRAKVSNARSDVTGAVGRNVLYVALHAAPAGSTVRCAEWVIIGNLDTSLYTVGKAIFLGESAAGAYTLADVKYPTQIGTVIQVSATVGAIILAPQVAYSRAYGYMSSNAQPTHSMMWIPILISTGTTGSPYTSNVPTGAAVNYEVVDAWTQCRAADAGGVAQVQNTGGTAITSTMACAVDTNLTRATTIDDATSIIAAGGVIRVAYTGGGVAGRGLVMVAILPRA